MSPLASFLHDLFREGVAHFREAPVPVASDADAARVLASVHAGCTLALAGPALPLDLATALAAAEVVRQACWLLVSREEAPEEVGRLVHLPGSPVTAESHLAGDLTLRYLPGVLRRARAASDAALADRLVLLLRDWPLSGVLADLDEPPAGDLHFGGHDGLMLLYAERWLAQSRPAWMPRDRGLAWLELARAAAPGPERSRP